MDIIGRVIQYYRKENGVVPYLDWYHSLRNDEVKDMVLTRLDRVRQGNFGDYKSVGGGIFELRFKMGPGYRIYFGMEGKTLIILYCAGDKDTQSRDVRLAQEYLIDYRRRSR